jgi:succinate-acetate transporter protein
MAMAAYLAVWGLFTLGMFVGTLRLNTALKVIFSTLTILFFLLAAHKALDAKPLGEQLGRIAGYEGIFCGASAFYAALAQVLNEVYGRVVLPLGDKKK